MQFAWQELNKAIYMHDPKAPQWIKDSILGALYVNEADL